MIKEKNIDYKSCKTITLKNNRNHKLTFLIDTIRLVKPAIEDIKNGNVITMEEFGVWLDELYAEYK